MPLYEYKCSACGQRFERIVKFSDPPVKTCPHCGKDAVEQQIHAPAVQFKGSGWYVSDYARKGKAGTASSSTSEGGSVSAAKEGGGTEGSSTSESAGGKGSTGAQEGSSGGASGSSSSAGEKK